MANVCEESWRPGRAARAGPRGSLPAAAIATGNTNERWRGTGGPTVVTANSTATGGHVAKLRLKEAPRADDMKTGKHIRV
jgi:hypothetical protein